MARSRHGDRRADSNDDSNSCSRRQATGARRHPATLGRRHRAWRLLRLKSYGLASKPGPRMGHKPRTPADTSGHSQALNPAGQQEQRSWQAGSLTPDLPSWWSPSFSLFDGLGRVRRVKAKPADADRFASLDTDDTAKGGQLRGGRGRGRARGTVLTVLVRRRSTHDHRAISVPLARVKRGQPGSLGTAGDAWSAPLAAVTARLPKLIVRVRFSSPALIVKAQARDGIPSPGLDHAGHFGPPCIKGPWVVACSAGCLAGGAPAVSPTCGPTPVEMSIRLTVVVSSR